MMRRTITLPLWAQMTILALIVSVGALLSISLVVGLHTWGDGTSLTSTKLNFVASMYALKLQDKLNQLVKQSRTVVANDLVMKAISASQSSNISIAEEAQRINQLGVYAKSMVTSQEGYRALLIYDFYNKPTYSLVLSDNTASLSAVLASLQELSPVLESPDSSDSSPWVNYLTPSVIVRTPVLTEPARGSPFYSFSITIPISNTDPAWIGLKGSATFVFDTNKLTEMILADVESVFPSGVVDVVIIKTRHNVTGFQYAASNADYTTSLTNHFYSFDDFPAVGAMAKMTVDDRTPINASSWIGTKSPNREEAAVGCAKFMFYQTEWVLCVETDQTKALSGVYSLRNRVIGLCIGMLGFILLMVIPTGRIMTSPLYSIYEQTSLDQVQIDGPPPKRTKRDKIKKVLWILGIGSLSRSGSQPATAKNELNDSDHDVFHVPRKIRPLNRKFYRDELDRLVEEYNGLVDELNTQYHYLEDQVKERTMEAQDARIAAEKANAAKSQFIANITHELRTPLNGIMGMTSVTLNEESVPKVKVALNIILKSGRTLMKLLNELLAFSKSQIDMEPNLSEFTPNEIFTHLENMANSRPETDKKDSPLKFVHYCDPTSLGNVQFMGDGHRISQICLHLMSNAVKFSTKDDQIRATIRYTNALSGRVSTTPYASLTAPATNLGMLEIAIIDSGSGIGEEHLATIFEPFVQGDDAFSKKYDGTGLGMSMCKQLAGTIGASLGVWSAKSKGTICVLEVPVMAPKGTITSPPLDLNRNGMFFTTSTSSGSVSKFQEARSTKRASYLSTEDSLLESGASASQVGAGASSIQGGNVSVTNSIISAQATPPGDSMHQHKKSVVGSIFSSFLQPPRESTSTNRLSSLRRHSRHKSTSTNSYHTAAPPEPVSPVPPTISPVASQAHSSAKSHAKNGKLAVASGQVRASSPSSSFNDFTAVQVSEEDRNKFSAVNHPNYKVLVADDNALNLEIMVKMLKRTGIEDVHTATDGEAVVKLVEKSIKEGFHYSVIFMDLSMPRLDGFQATHIIRRTLGYPYPIIALTGYSDQRTKRMCDSSNIQEILVKPVLRDALISVLITYDSNSMGSQTDLRTSST